MSISTASTSLPAFYAATKSSGVPSSLILLLVVAIIIGLSFLSRRPAKRKSALPAVSSADMPRVRTALASLTAVDPEARNRLDSRFADVDRLFQMLAPQEEITWMQCATLATDSGGEVNRFTFEFGILVLTPRNLVFAGETDSRNGRWPLATLNTVNLFEVGVSRSSRMLQLSAGGTRIGFDLRDRAAARELAKRLRSSIAQASGSSSEIRSAGSADELAKWAKLRSEGVITEEEFHAQKSKILDR